MYWHQGFEHAPELVKMCVNSWRHYHPKNELILLSEQNLSEYLDLPSLIPVSRLKNVNLTALSDIIRVHLLSVHGGIWIDSTVLCLKPLSDWIEPYLSPSPFFGFSNPGSDRLISSWFLIAPADHHITQKWAKATRLYWSRRHWFRKYYWFHNLFKDLYLSDEQVRLDWDNNLKFSADGPHYFTPFREKFFAKATDEKIQDFEQANLPLVKLTYKCIKDGYPKHSMIDYLLNRREL